MSTNPNVVILNKAWALLWREDSAYYLPKILREGGTFGKTVIPPMDSVKVPQIDPIPLYSSDTWGDVKIELSAMTLDGLPSIQNVSFTPSSDATSVEAVVGFGELTFQGSYEVVGSGLVGCAMDIAQGEAYRHPPRDTEVSVTPPPEQLELARRYRAELVKSQNGSELVGRYYDHNDTINRILSQENAFTEVWPQNAPLNPPEQNTAYYMQVTTNATAHPDDPNYTVGGNDTGYLTHSAYMQVMLIGTCQHYEDTDPEHAEDYRALAASAANFRGYTNQYPDPMTADAVMGAVVNGPRLSDEQLAAVPEPEAVRAGREAGERDFEQVHRQAMAKRAARLQQATTYKSRGNFGFSFRMPTLTFGGDVAVSGIPPEQVLTVTLQTLTADIPEVKINLFTGSDPNFTADAQSRINDAQWFQRVLGTKVNAKLGSSEVRDYLSDLCNQAILGVLGRSA